MKKALTLLLSLAMLFSLAACGRSGGDSTDDAPSTLVYGSADYTRIDPAMDEHGEINLLLFDGLTAHDGDEQRRSRPRRDAGTVTRQRTPTLSTCAKTSHGTTASRSRQAT